MWHAVSSDKRHFRMLTSSREGFFGERRIGTCKGSFQCCNKECPFIKTSHCHQPNRVSWRNVRCTSCESMCYLWPCCWAPQLRCKETYWIWLLHTSSHSLSPWSTQVYTSTTEESNPYATSTDTTWTNPKGLCKRRWSEADCEPYRCRRHGCSWERSWSVVGQAASEEAVGVNGPPARNGPQLLRCHGHS